MIRGVVFDLFGTLIPCPDMTSHYEMLNEMADSAGIERGIYADLWHDTNSERMIGKGGSALGFVEHMFRDNGHAIDRGRSMEVEKIYDRYTSDLMVLFPDVPPLLNELQDREIRIGLLTNCGSNVPTFFGGLNEAEFFHSLGYSSRIGYRKPDPAIFRWSIEDMGTDPTETLFVGDGDSGELAGASKAGMTAVKIFRGETNGDYRLTPQESWDPTIKSMTDLISLIDDL